MPKRTSYENLEIVAPGKDTQIAGILGDQPAKETAQRSARVVSIPLSQILPDKFQARVILPPDLKQQFFAGEADCYVIAQALLVAADSDQGLRRQIDELLELGDSIHNNGQVEPATGSWTRTAIGPRFLLEAGERRFWSMVLFATHQGLEEEPRLNVVEEKDSSRLRQVAENLQREDLSAVDLGKAVASLILVSLEVLPSPEMDEVEYYRQAVQMKRIPSGTWPLVQQVTGQSQSYLSRHLNILNLDDELLYLASLYRLNESVLRQILAAPKSQQRDLIILAIQDELVAADIPAVVNNQVNKKDGATRSPQGPYRQLASRVKSLVKFVRQSEFDQDYDQVAVELSTLYQDPDDLISAAEDLEALASSLRKIRDRRTR